MFHSANIQEKTGFSQQFTGNYSFEYTETFCKDRAIKTIGRDTMIEDIEYDPKEIGLRIKELREAKGYHSQTKFARDVGIAQQSYDAIERGTTKRSKYLPQIAKTLGVPLKIILFGDDKTLTIPFVQWIEIPDICKSPEKAKDLKNYNITLAFRKEKDLYATKIPDTRIPGFSMRIFDPKDDLLISPHREPKHGLPIIVSSDSWSEPEHAVYWIRGDEVFLKFPNERLTRKTKDIHICGVVIARVNIFI